MKRIIRIILGIFMGILLLIFGTLIWIVFIKNNKTSWKECIGKIIILFITGNWDELDDGDECYKYFQL